MKTFYLTGQRIIKRLRESTFESIMRQEIGFFDKTRTGELVNRLSTDTSLIGQSVTNNVSDGLRAIVQAIGGIGMMVRNICFHYLKFDSQFDHRNIDL